MKLTRRQVSRIPPREQAPKGSTAFAFTATSPNRGRMPVRLIRPRRVTYLVLKYVHLLGAMVILGTGAGIAFFMLMAHLSRDTAFIARTASIVVMADMMFTATAVILQPITGYMLVSETGIALTEGWVVASLALYVVAGAFWLPVVWIQIQMRDLAKEAIFTGSPLPGRYHRLFRIWFAFGIPGFGSVMLIIWLMIAKPSL